MNLPRKCTAIKALLLLAWLGAASCAHAAQVAATVVNLSGPLVAKKPDGSLKVLSQKSTVEQGDILITEQGTYARIKFTDNSEVTLRPNTQFKVENFSFDEDKPQADNASFNLIKGGLRAVTGTLGKRSKEKVGFNTPTATIGIRGTIFIAEYVPPDSAAMAAYAFASMAAMAPESTGRLTMTDAATDTLLPVGVVPLQLAQAAPVPGGSGAPRLAPGLYVQVLDGMIHLSNNGGSQNFSAGQFGYTPSFTQPPVIVPNNPGIQFTPPPAFNTSTGPQTSTGNAAKGAAVDCEVR